MTKEHDQIRRLIELSHYEDHPDRKESEAFRKIKQHYHEIDAPCFIDNKYCSPGIEIHHSIIEWSAWTAIEKSKVDFHDPDTLINTMPLCKVHHTSKGYGIHSITYPIWILQKYMNEEALDDFHNAVEKMLQEEKHGNA
jgi:hypothetical protein